MVQKRALERRRVFMDHLEKLEKFLGQKQKKMKQIKKRRLLQEKKNKLEKEILQKRKKGMAEDDMKSIMNMLSKVDYDINNEVVSDDSQNKPTRDEVDSDEYSEGDGIIVGS